MTIRDNPLKALCGLVLALALIAYLAACDWNDQRKARKAGAEWEPAQ